MGIGGLGGANESFIRVFSGLMVIGLDRGDGLVSLLFISEEVRGGMFIILASFLAMDVACNPAELDVGIAVALSCLDCQRAISTRTKH